MIDAVDCQPSEPPLMLGSVGAVRSIRTVPVASGGVGVQSDRLPAASTARNSISVSPSSLIVASGPAVGADQLPPPSVDVRYW